MSKKAVVINGKRYASARVAADELHISYNVLARMLRSDNYPNYVIQSGPIPITIDGVVYESIESAAAALKLSVYKVKQRLMEVGNGEVPYVHNAAAAKAVGRQSKLKTGSKPVSINGIRYPTISAARFYNARFGDRTVSRNAVLLRLNSDKPKWAEWKFITEDELPERLPKGLTDTYLNATAGCVIQHHGFVIMRYFNDSITGRYAMIGDVAISATPLKNTEHGLSFKLATGKYLNVSGSGMPDKDTPDYLELRETLTKYLASKDYRG